jgi:hypothetical protein
MFGIVGLGAVWGYGIWGYPEWGLADIATTAANVILTDMSGGFQSGDMLGGMGS